jgi:L-malate glycosyltransferase
MQHGHSSAVVPNAINVELFDVSSGEEGKSKMINESKRISEKRRVRVLYLGALIKSKGVHVLARALRGLNCRTDFYGEGGLEKEIKGIIKVEGIDATIHKPVSYNQIPAIYAQADIVVFPSIWPEPFGRIAIEAMAAGKAVIGSEIGGIKETIAKDAGVLVKAGSVHELHEALQKLIDNSKLRGQMGKVGKREALAYQEEKVLARLLKLYEEKK